MQNSGTCPLFVSSSILYINTRQKQSHLLVANILICTKFFFFFFLLEILKTSEIAFLELI